MRRLRHLPREAFLAHFFAAHRPGASAQKGVPVVGPVVTKHGTWSELHDGGFVPWLIGRQMFARFSTLMHTLVASDKGERLSSIWWQPQLSASGGGGCGSGGGGYGDGGGGDGEGGDGGVGGEGG